MITDKNTPDPEKINAAVRKKQCLVCKNYKAVHPVTNVSYCVDGSKTVFVDSGCGSWRGVNQTQTPRDAFEAWAKSRHLEDQFDCPIDITRADEFGPGDKLTYCERNTRKLWAAWQASQCAHLQITPQIPPEKAPSA